MWINHSYKTIPETGESKEVPGVETAGTTGEAVEHKQQESWTEETEDAHGQIWEWIEKG